MQCLRELSSHREVRLLCQLPQTGTREQVKLKIWGKKAKKKWKSGKKTNCATTRRQHVQDNGARSGSKRATSEPNRRSKTSGRWFVVLLSTQIQRQKCKYKYKYNATKTKKQHQWQVICASFKHLDSFVWKQLRSNVLPLPCYSNQLSWLSKSVKTNQRLESTQTTRWVREILTEKSLLCLGSAQC